jgi:hypothetical protein
VARLLRSKSLSDFLGNYLEVGPSFDARASFANGRVSHFDWAGRHADGAAAFNKVVAGCIGGGDCRALVNSLGNPGSAIDFSDPEYFEAHSDRDIGTL